MKEEKKNEKGSTLKVIFGVTICIMIVLFVVAYFSDNINLIFRKAKAEDIYIDTAQEISLNITYEMTPNTNIDGLELTFEYYDNNYKLQTTKVERIGNVKKGIKYSINVSMAEFSLSQLFKINRVKCSVTNGRVALI